MANVLVEYRLEPGGRWLLVIGAAGATYDETAADMQRLHGAVECRPREEHLTAQAAPAAAGGVAVTGPPDSPPPLELEP